MTIFFVFLLFLSVSTKDSLALAVESFWKKNSQNENRFVYNKHLKEIQDNFQKLKALHMCSKNQDIFARRDELQKIIPNHDWIFDENDTDFNKKCILGTELFQNTRKFQKNIEFSTLKIIELLLSWILENKRQTLSGDYEIKTPPYLEEDSPIISIAPFIKNTIYNIINKYFPYKYNLNSLWMISEGSLLLCELLDSMQILEGDRLIEQIEKTLSFTKSLLKSFSLEDYLKTLFDNTDSSIPPLQAEKIIYQCLKAEDLLFVTQQLVLPRENVLRYYSKKFQIDESEQTILPCSVNTEYKNLRFSCDGISEIINFLRNDLHLNIFFIHYTDIPHLQENIDLYLKDGENTAGFILTLMKEDSFIEAQKTSPSERKSNQLGFHIAPLIVQKSQKTGKTHFYYFDFVGERFSPLFKKWSYLEKENNIVSFYNKTVTIDINNCQLTTLYFMTMALQDIKQKDSIAGDLLNFLNIKETRSRTFSFPARWSFVVTRSKALHSEIVPTDPLEEVLRLDSHGYLQSILYKDFIAEKDQRELFNNIFVRKGALREDYAKIFREYLCYHRTLGEKEAFRFFMYLLGEQLQKKWNESYISSKKIQNNA